MTEVEEAEEIEAAGTPGTPGGAVPAGVSGAPETAEVTDPVDIEVPAATEGPAAGEAAPDEVDGSAVDSGQVDGAEVDGGQVDAGSDQFVESPPPEFRVMDVEDVSLELPSQYPQVTLVENEPPLRSLVFPVGLTEGTALALALRRMESPRPMTHELFMEVMERAHIDVIALRLIGRENGVTLAELDLMAPLGRERIPCRPSDGLVLALRMPVSAPILVDERLLEDAGDVVPYDDE
jgi:bifunctional DNase/RNase